MFGFSFAELVVVIVVALVVIGPKDLPRLLRKLGEYAGKLRRTAADLRAQSGIDDALRAEGLSEDIAEIRKLARGELDVVRRAAAVDLSARSFRPEGASESGEAYGAIEVPKEREYPKGGADSYGALPENAFVYAGSSAPSALATFPLYATGSDVAPRAEASPTETVSHAPIAEAEAGEPASGAGT